MAKKNVLVVGATGRQGRALIHALCPGPDEADSDFHLLALTRNAKGPIANGFALDKHVTVVEGDLDKVDSLRKIFEDAKAQGGIWGVFLVLAFPGLGANADGEERQGTTLANISLEFGVSSFIYSSVERGAEENDAKAVLDRLAKVRIEHHISELGAKGLSWTILRPGFFMENYEGTVGSITAAVLKAGLKPTTAIQLVAVQDIGHVAAGVFKDPKPYLHQVLLVVGEILTMEQQDGAYRKATGRPITSMPDWLARGLLAINRHTRELIRDVERVNQERVDGQVPEKEKQLSLAKQAYQQMFTFESWAETRKSKDSTRSKNWNQISVGRLAAGKQ